MMLPSRALMDVFPKVLAGKEQGIITPGTIGKGFSLDYTLSNTAGITWKVPLNTSPVYYRGIPTIAVCESDVEVFFTYQEALSAFLVGQTAQRGVNNNITAPTLLPEFSQQLRKSCFDYAVDCNIYALERGEEYGEINYFRAGLETFLQGFVPYIADYGEGFGMEADGLRLEKNRLFNYPKSILEYRFITSNIVRILTELSKTPLVYMVVVDDLNDPFFLDATTLGELAGNDETSEDWQGHFDPTKRGPVLLRNRAASTGIGPLPGRVLFGSFPVSRHEYDPPRYSQTDITSSQLLPYIHAVDTGKDEFNAFFSRGTAVFFEAIAAATARLRAMNVPMLTIPQIYGGGEKYVVVLPLSLLNSGMEWTEKDVLFIGVPGDLLAAVTYPCGLETGVHYMPANPTYTAYVVGSPGVFNFTTDTGKTGFVSDVTDFDRLGKEGWEDRNTYHSARAPMGQILATGTVDITKAYRFPPQALWQLNSQDTIKIVICPLRVGPDSEKNTSNGAKKAKRGAAK